MLKCFILSLSLSLIFANHTHMQITYNPLALTTKQGSAFCVCVFERESNITGVKYLQWKIVLTVNLQDIDNKMCFPCWRYTSLK